MMAGNVSNLITCEEKFTGVLYVIKEILYKDRYLNISKSE